MRALRIHRAALLTTAVLALAGTPAANSAEAHARRLGDHPAIVVQRLQKSAGYDFASKFYPHPAWLHLYAQPPRDMFDPAQLAGAAAVAGGFRHDE